MTTITLEGKEYQLDIEQAKKLNLLKEKDNKVRSWEEFKKKCVESGGYYWSDFYNNLMESDIPVLTKEQLTPHEAKALAAFSKLLKLRRDWIGEWEPDWSTLDERKYVIERKRISQFEVLVYFTNSHALSFPSYELAQEFLETFRDLIEEAKILI
jgi:hypothetical protein